MEEVGVVLAMPVAVVPSSHLVRMLPVALPRQRTAPHGELPDETSRKLVRETDLIEARQR